MIVAIGSGKWEPAYPGGKRVAKPEWGTKRWCLSCGAPFYDLRRNPIVCPLCHTDLKPEGAARSEPRRAAAKPVAKPSAPKRRAAFKNRAAVRRSEGLMDLAGAEKADDKEEFIEDASELGEDEDDMAVVLEGAVAAGGDER